MKTYQITYNNLTRMVRANSEWEAKALFQERWGFWPSDELASITELS